MANTKSIGVAFLDQNIDGADFVYVDSELGYTAAAQGTVTQLTDKSTAVTLNKSAGQITMNNAQLNATTNVTFTLNNSTVSAKDVVILSVASGATAGAYNCWVSGKGTGTVTITVRNISGGNLSEAVVINFAVIHCI
jgi:membrane-bound inhibitor of C-type lysozyme